LITIRNYLIKQLNFSSFTVDFANGINSLKFRKLAYCVKDHLTVEIFNRPEATKKRKAGAGYVFTYQRAPDKMSLFPGDKCVAMNYEGSKLVYFYRATEESAVRVLDGSRLAALFARYFKELLSKTDSSAQLAVIMSAGCNTGSVQYIHNKLQLYVYRAHLDRNQMLREATRHQIALMFDEEGFGMLYMEAPYARRVFQSAQKGCIFNKRLWSLYQTFGLVRINCKPKAMKEQL
jgi:hypothetical protein